MHHRLFALLIALSLLVAPAPAADLPRGNPHDAGLSVEKLDRIESMLKEAVAAKHLAGGSALIARHGKIVYLKPVGLRDTQPEAPMTDDTIFRIASMTKPITSVAAMILVEDGKLNLDDPIGKYIPAWREPKVLVINADKTTATSPAKSPITIHHLLTHTSGITYRFADPPQLGKLYADANIHDGLCERPLTLGANVTRLAQLPLKNHPGQAWEYGLSSDVLARIIEIASGQSFDAFLRQRIFQPLKMDDTAFLVSPDKAARLSALFSSYNEGDIIKIRRLGDEFIRKGQLIYSATYPTSTQNKYHSGGAGLSCTILDYARFLQMLLSKGQLDGVRILKPETVELMTRNQIGDLLIPFPSHGDAFGYGFGILTDRGKDQDPSAVGSYSWGGLFYTYFWVDPQNDLIGILMTQVHPSDHLKLREEFKKLTYEALQQ
jgi:CubicO group peptidase (beta-lactamase class C family)